MRRLRELYARGGWSLELWQEDLWKTILVQPERLHRFEVRMMDNRPAGSVYDKDLKDSVLGKFIDRDARQG